MSGRSAQRSYLSDAPVFLSTQFQSVFNEWDFRREPFGSSVMKLLMPQVTTERLVQQKDFWFQRIWDLQSLQTRDLMADAIPATYGWAGR
ncbi:hypothetical protein [Novipirellula sp.]|uniref:hypothetical protein n=1 Tax=Novipirellula sp. TaxID=2795430 RepID=UPI00356B006E